MSIVTKTGDQGETQLFDGSRISKTDPRISVLGDLDELSAALGMVEEKQAQPDIQELQRELLHLGALIANPRSQELKYSQKSKRLQKIKRSHKVKQLQNTMTASLQRIERLIPPLEASLPPLQNFILPGGHPDAARLHFARSICRRAERHLCTLKCFDAIPYLNRVSDFLFLWARKINRDSGTKEIIWKTKTSLSDGPKQRHRQ